MIRATTGGVLRSYRSNLMSSFIAQNKARDTVLSQRNFNSYAEDPGSAAHAFQLRRSLMATESQYQINSSVISKYDSGWKSLDTVVGVASNYSANSIKEAVQRALNDPTGDARRALSKELNELADTVVQSMNTKYGETFVFAGADGLNVPFSFNEDDQLCYRGVPVDSHIPDVVLDASGNPATVTNGTDSTYLLKENTKLVSIADYKRRADGSGNPLTVDASGIPVAAGTSNSYYLYDNKITTMSVEEYDALSVEEKPTILRDAGGNQLTTIVDGTEYVQVIDHAMVSTEDYPTVMMGSDGNPLEVNGDRNVEAGGGYYIIADSLTDEDYLTPEEYTTEVENFEKLEFMSNEKYFVDIGLGMKEMTTADNQDKLIESSAFNAALVGINYIGYGVDSEGDPKNIVSLVKEMSQLCTQLVPDGKWANEAGDEMFRLAQKLEDATSKLHTMHTDLTAATNKLKNNEEILEENAYTLQTQISDIEDVDMAEAITAFIWGQYCYNAALKVGNSILSQSLMDYLN